MTLGRMSLKFALVIGLVAASWSSPLHAEESGWKLPNLNPFAAKKPAPTSKNNSGWSMPSLWPKSTSKKSSQPSTWSKMQSGTKQFFSKTADVLNPFDDAKDPPKSSGSSSGMWNPFQSASNSSGTPAKKSSWSWGAAEEEKPSGPRTVNEFLAQPKPAY